MDRLGASVPAVNAPTPGSRRDPATPILLALFAAKLAVVLFAANRGFELGDEGYFLLNLNQPDAALPALEFYRFFSVLRGGVEIGVVEARLLRVAAEIIGSLALILGVYAWAARRAFSNDPPSRPAFVAWCLLGTFLSVASRSFGYNDMTNLFTYSAVGCVFGLASQQDGSAARRAAFAVAAGALTGLQLTAKFPPGFILLGAFPLVVSFALPRLGASQKLQLLSWFLVGVSALVAVVVAATGGVAVMAERLAITATLPALTGYDPFALLVRYAKLDLYTETNLLLFLAVFAAVRVLLLRNASGTPARAHGIAFLVAALVLWPAVLRWHPAFLHWSLVYLACVVIGTAIALGVADWRRFRPGAAGAPAGERRSLLALLLVLPFVEIAGTNVPITMRLPTHVLPLFVLLAVLVSEAGGARFRRGVALTLALVTSVAFVQHHWFRPYGLRDSISAQTSEAPGLPGVRVDLATARFLELVASALAEAGFRRGDPLIALDYMPGLTYFAGGTSPRYNLYMFDMEAFSCFNLDRARFDSPPFLVVAQPISPGLESCVRSIDLREGFRVVRTLRFPYESVYAGFGKPGFTHVEILAPREGALRQGR